MWTHSGSYTEVLWGWCRRLTVDGRPLVNPMDRHSVGVPFQWFVPPFLVLVSLSHSLSFSFSSRRDSTQQHCIRGALDFDPVNLQRGPRKEDVAPLNPVMFFVSMMIASQRCIASAVNLPSKDMHWIHLVSSTNHWVLASGQPGQPGQPNRAFLSTADGLNRLHSSNYHEISK